MTEQEVRDSVLTLAQVVELLSDHDASLVEFFEEFGSHAQYDGDAVLTWLGY